MPFNMLNKIWPSYKRFAGGAETSRLHIIMLSGAKREKGNWEPVGEAGGISLTPANICIPNLSIAGPLGRYPVNAISFCNWLVLKPRAAALQAPLPADGP